MRDDLSHVLRSPCIDHTIAEASGDWEGVQIPNHSGTSMAHRFSDLPQELLHCIVKFLKYDVLSLRNLSLTSRGLTYEAQSNLYADVRVVPIRQTFRTRACIDYKRSEKFFTTLVIHNPFLAKHVRCFVYSAYFPRDPDAQDLVLRSLQLMTNIKILEFIPVDEHDVPTNPFQGCTFQLTHFHCNFDISAEFLSTQFALRSLHPERNVDVLPVHFCANVGTLRIKYWREAAKFLPGRSVRRLEFAGVWRNDSPFPFIAAELRNLTVLVFEYPLTLQSRGIETMIPYLTQLHLLRVNGGSQFIKRLYSSPEIILGLQTLEIFIYSMTPFFFTELFNPERHTDMVKMWFQKMPKFEAAYIEIACHEEALENYERWLVDDTKPTLVGREEALLEHGLYDSYAEEHEVLSAQ